MTLESESCHSSLLESVEMLQCYNATANADTDGDACAGDEVIVGADGGACAGADDNAGANADANAATGGDKSGPTSIL